VYRPDALPDAQPTTSKHLRVVKILERSKHFCYWLMACLCPVVKWDIRHWSGLLVDLCRQPSEKCWVMLLLQLLLFSWWLLVLSNHNCLPNWYVCSCIQLIILWELWLLLVMQLWTFSWRVGQNGNQ